MRVWKIDKKAVLARLTEWAQRLRSEDPNVLAIVLFGSLARGDATAASDADVLILLEDSSLDFADRFAEYKPVGLGISVEVFPYTIAEARSGLEEGWGVVRPALHEGRMLAGSGDLEQMLKMEVARQRRQSDA